MVRSNARPRCRMCRQACSDPFDRSCTLLTLGDSPALQDLTYSQPERESMLA
jgi:hypothetical protein